MFTKMVKYLFPFQHFNKNNKMTTISTGMRKYPQMLSFVKTKLSYIQNVIFKNNLWHAKYLFFKLHMHFSVLGHPNYKESQSGTLEHAV
jgi:hypothetical protein